MFSQFFIDRPIFASVISIVIVMGGLLSLPMLPVEKTPDITPPTVTVETYYPGANAETVAETVATPIEEAINGVDHMLYMSSSCSNNGRMEITVTFEIGTDPDMATVFVQNRVAMAEPKLPEEVKRQGITTRKRSTNITLVVALYSPDKRYDDVFMSNYINLRMKDELARVPGVGNVMVLGAKDFAMRLWLDPEKLKARGLTTNDVLAAVRAQNIEVAPGQIGGRPSPDEQKFQYTIKTFGRLETAEQFGDIILKAAPDGRILRVKDVARVELGADTYDIDVTFKGQLSVGMGIFQTPGANAVEVAKGVYECLEKLSKDFPPGLQYYIPYNPTTFISESIHEVLITLVITVVLVVLIVYIFLEDWRATLVPAVTIPVSLIGTLAVMLALDMSINTLSMFGLVLVIGIVVDDAIIVVENVCRLMEEEKLSPHEAAVKAMRQVSGPIIATTLVLLAVFVPTVVMGGITGRLYQQFGITISVATLFSGVNALTLSPALCALLLRPRHGESKGLTGLFTRFLKSVTFGYTGVVAILVRKTALLAMIAFIIMTVGALAGFKNLPTGFIPDEDEGAIFVNVALPDGASIQRTNEVSKKVFTILENTPGIKEYLSVSGFSLINGGALTNNAAFFIKLDPWEKRQTPDLKIKSIIEKVQAQLFTIPDAFCMAFQPPAIHGLGYSGGFEMKLQDRGGAGLSALESTANAILGQARQSPLINPQRLNSTLSASIPQLYIDLDRVKAQTLDVPLTNIFDTLNTYLGSSYINDFNLFGRTFKVKAQADQSFRTSPENILDLEVRSNLGQMIPLRTMLTVRNIVGPQMVTHYNLFSSSTITGSPNPGFSSGQTIAEMQKICQNLPANFSYEWSGMSLQEITAGSQATKIFLIAAAFAFLFLAAQYESWSVPFAVIFSVPLALLGVVLFTWVREFDNNIYTQIGIVLLIGLASKTAILLVEFAKVNHEKEGLSVEDAAIVASRLRFRPILMTALTSGFGTLPLVIATGAGAIARQALGTAVFGGMLIATIVGVLMIPVFYVVVQKIAEVLRPKKS